MGFIRIGGYPMDLVMTEEISHPGEATNYPVEAGADISDHIRELPDEITLTDCIVSDTPIGDIAADQTRQATPGPDGTVPLVSNAAYAKLREMKSIRKTLTVETSLGAFADMAFLSLDITSDAKRTPGRAGRNGEAINGVLWFTAKFKRVVFVTNQRTKVRVRTAMPMGAKVKVIVGKVIEIDTFVPWLRGDPAGSPPAPGTTIEVIDVSYSKSVGITRDARVAAMRGQDPGSPLITYTYTIAHPGDLIEIGDVVTGFARLNLIADLRRDRNRARSKSDSSTNLPDGINQGRMRVPGFFRTGA